MVNTEEELMKRESGGRHYLKKTRLRLQSMRYPSQECFSRVLFSFQPRAAIPQERRRKTAIINRQNVYYDGISHREQLATCVIKSLTRKSMRGVGIRKRNDRFGTLNRRDLRNSLSKFRCYSSENLCCRIRKNN